MPAASSGGRRRLHVVSAAGVLVPVSIKTTADQAGPVGAALQSAVSAGTVTQQLQQQGARPRPPHFMPQLRYQMSVKDMLRTHLSY